MPHDPGFELGFRTLDDEVADRQLAVEGDLPGWLDGALVRNGPAKFEVDGERVAHWFDGLAMLHRFDFDDGLAYTNRFLRSETYETATTEGIHAAQFASGGGGYLRRLRTMLLGDPTDNANVHVARFDGELVALTEVPRYVRVDAETLETRGEFAFADALSGTLNCAHVIPDPHRGETLGLLTAFGRRNRYRLFRVPDGTRRREEIATIPVEEPAYVHSFAATARYVVLTEHPFTVRPREFLLPGGEGFVDFFDFHPERPTRFHVVDRATGDVVATPETAAFFVFHHVNAFEDGEELVVDLIAYPDAGVVEGLYLDAMGEWLREGEDGRLRRYRLRLDDGGVASTTLSEGIELPRIAPADRTRRHRYVYGQGAADESGNHLRKVDCETGATRRWGEPGTYVEEPVFVRAPGGDGDEGVVLVTALNTREARTDLLVVDGETLDLRARAPLPHAVPFGFHGRYVPE